MTAALRYEYRKRVSGYSAIGAWSTWSVAAPQDHVRTMLQKSGSELRVKLPKADGGEEVTEWRAVVYPEVKPIPSGVVRYYPHYNPYGRSDLATSYGQACETYERAEAVGSDWLRASATKFPNAFFTIEKRTSAR